MFSTFPNFKQAESRDCGPTCLKIVSAHYGKTLSIEKLREMCETTKEGSNMLFLSDVAEKIGFRTLGVKLSPCRLPDATLPCILHWNKEHYVVLYAIKRGKFYVSDPAIGRLSYTKDQFIRSWIGNNAGDATVEGVALLLEPTPDFDMKHEVTPKIGHKTGLKILKHYILPHKRFLVQLAFGLLLGNALQLLFPFLTQSIVDVGIKNHDIGFIYLVLAAQLFLFVSRTVLEFSRSWLLLHLSTRVNISLVSDFFIKLMNLPISYFDSKMTGDIFQRIADHKRIESVLTTSSLNILFSTITIIVMGGVLAYYNMGIFLVFLIGSVAYVGWILLFLKHREKLDYKRFSQLGREQSKIIEIVNGMQEIKLHNAEKQKRWEWEYLQGRVFKISMSSLSLEQYQTVGSTLINELKNILIIFLSAQLVIKGDITLGMMLAISAITGSLNAPVTQFIGFIREVQDAKIALERLSEIHDKADEAKADTPVTSVPRFADIAIENLSFRYPGTDTRAIDELNLTIPANKTTAIVGASGSGKTTLMKLLLKFYQPTDGQIYVGEHDLSDIEHKAWRASVGAVMQEGYIFHDTVAANIAVGVDSIDEAQLLYAASVANIDSFVSNLALGYNTVIGNEGVGMSTGQKQRLLIARAVYKNPDILFFDEATSSLDARNEREIMEKLGFFFRDKTVVVIAHRLSTVKNADQIVVMENGRIIEIGTHDELVNKSGDYFDLIRNQLQLGA